MPAPLKEMRDGIAELEARRAAMRDFGEGVRKTMYLGLPALPAVGGFVGGAIAILLEQPCLSRGATVLSYRFS